MSLLLASAQRTSDANSADQLNVKAHKGVVIFIDVTARAAGNVTVTLQGKDPISGTYYTLLAGTALASVTTERLQIYPGMLASANAKADEILPSIWRVNADVSVGGDLTFSVSGVTVP